jgi:hypothetical protein
VTYTFTGPGTYVFPELAGPPESEAGTLTAVPGETYDFAGDPPGPATWWSSVSTGAAAAEPAMVAPAAPVPALEAPPEEAPEDAPAAAGEDA